jgi:hypothetical protein
MAKARKEYIAKENLPMAAVFADIAHGFSARSACTRNGCPPSSFFKTISENPAFQEEYARAKEIGLEMLADELIDIADGSDPLDVNRARLRVDTRKWVLCKLLPKKYGDKTEVEHSGGTTVNIVSSGDYKKQAKEGGG